MFNQIIQLDQQLFFAINHGLSNPFFDFLMPILRERLIWIPLYAFLAFFLIKKYGKYGLLLILFFVFTFGIADFFTASIIKPFVERLRPCNDPMIRSSVLNLIPCGSGYSFPSSHAANHFGISFFILFTWLRHQPLAKFLVIFWACLVVYAQLYVVVHYPSDVVAGALVGIVYSSLLAEWYLRRFGDIDMQKLPASNS